MKFQNFRKWKSDLKSAPFKKDTDKILLRLETWCFLVQNAKILGFGLKILINKWQIWNEHIQNRQNFFN